MSPTADHDPGVSRHGARRRGPVPRLRLKRGRGRGHAVWKSCKGVHPTKRRNPSWHPLKGCGDPSWQPFMATLHGNPSWQPFMAMKGGFIATHHGTAATTATRRRRRARGRAPRQPAAAPLGSMPRPLSALTRRAAPSLQALIASDGPSSMPPNMQAGLPAETQITNPRHKSESSSSPSSTPPAAQHAGKPSGRPLPPTPRPLPMGPTVSQEADPLARGAGWGRHPPPSLLPTRQPCSPRVCRRPPGAVAPRALDPGRVGRTPRHPRAPLRPSPPPGPP
jgi:hypothetical protein